MKRLLTLIMAAAILFSLAAWASAETPSTEKQLQFLSENLNSISQRETASPWYYAITDFDHNGLLEAVAVSADGYSTNVLAWEVDAAASGLKKCGFLLGKDESYPDILTDSVDTYHYEDDDKWYYVFSDAINNAGSFNRNKCSITLLGGNFIYKLYATESSEFLNGLTVITFSDAEGKMITPDVYESAEKSALAGAKKSSSSFGWFKMDASTGLQTLTDSFAVFMGEKAPDDNSVIHEYDELLQESQNSVPEVSEPEAEPIPEEQAPASEYPEGVFEYTAPDVEVFYYDGNNGAGTSGKTENFTKPSAAQNGSNGETEIFYIDQPSSPVEVFIPTPAPTPKPVYLSVTRNPTNELRKPGDTARFVACANAIDSLQWSFVSPDGSSISASEFANRFPGSSVDGSSTTLSISNVSADMGGWGAYCTFRTNDGQSVTTSTAYIIMK